RHDAIVWPHAGQARGEPVRGPDGDAAGHGLGVRPASPRARAQRRGVRRPAGRAGRARDEAGQRVSADPDEAASGFRAEVRGWLSAHVPAEPLPSMDTREGFARHRAWERELAAARLSAVSWPPEYGGRGAAPAAGAGFLGEGYAAGAPAARAPHQPSP